MLKTKKEEAEEPGSPKVNLKMKLLKFGLKKSEESQVGKAPLIRVSMPKQRSGINAEFNLLSPVLKAPFV